MYYCKECYKTFEQKSRKCPNCDAWNSLLYGKPLLLGQPIHIKEIETEDVEKITCNDERLKEFDECLQGGTVPGLSYLLGGEPGIGKSTLSIQWLNCMSKYGPALYISGEEAGRHIGLRNQRVIGDNADFMFLEERNIEKICEQIDNIKPAFMVCDSVQVLSINGLRTGSIQCQIESLNMLINSIKKYNTTALIVSHVNKDGDIAGPKTVEHLVDCVIQFEGERKEQLRIIRTIKNRFGETRMGIFEMKKDGLYSVSNDKLLKAWNDNIPGRVATIALEDSRPIAIEIQVLLGPSIKSTPRRYSQGYPLGRLNMLLAVLERKGISTVDREVYVNVVGGIQLSDTGIDVALARAIVDASMERPSDASKCWIGELGLLGDTINPKNSESRKRIADKMNLEYIFPNNIKEIIN